MDLLARELLAQCHAEAHHRGVQAGQPPVPCLHCGRDYRGTCGRGCIGVEGLQWYSSQAVAPASSRPRREASIGSGLSYGGAHAEIVRGKRLEISREASVRLEPNEQPHSESNQSGNSRSNREWFPVRHSSFSRCFGVSVMAPRMAPPTVAPKRHRAPRRIR